MARHVGSDAEPLCFLAPSHHSLGATAHRYIQKLYFLPNNWEEKVFLTSFLPPSVQHATDQNFDFCNGSLTLVPKVIVSFGRSDSWSFDSISTSK